MLKEKEKERVEYHWLGHTVWGKTGPELHGNIFQQLWWASGIIDGNASRQSSLGTEHGPNVKSNNMFLNNGMETRRLGEDVDLTV